MIVRFLFCLTCLSFFGCSTLKVIDVPLDKPVLDLKDPDAIDLDKFEIIVITKDNIDKVLSELESKGQKKVLFALSTIDYKAMILDINKLKEYIERQKAILEQYRNYYEYKK